MILFRIIKHREICDVRSIISISAHEIHISHYLMLMGMLLKMLSLQEYGSWKDSTAMRGCINLLGVMHYNVSADRKLISQLSQLYLDLQFVPSKLWTTSRINNRMETKTKYRIMKC